MTATALLNKVKTGLGITGDYHNDILQIYIDTAKQFMLSAGVASGIVNSEVAVGCILIGVNDLWNYSSGKAEFSEFFKQRVTQLALTDAVNYTPIMAYSTCVPTTEDAAAFGWLVGASGIIQNMPACTFTVTDSQRVICTITKPDGSILTGENTGTGNRRNIRIDGKYIFIMPNTLYNASTNVYEDGNGTSITFPTIFSDCEIMLETFDKAVE